MTTQRVRILMAGFAGAAIAIALLAVGPLTASPSDAGPTATAGEETLQLSSPTPIGEAAPLSFVAGECFGNCSCSGCNCSDGCSLSQCQNGCNQCFEQIDPEACEPE